MPRSSFGTEIAVWDQLAAALERYAAELSHLQEQRAQLAAALDRAKALRRRQAAQDARLRITTQELQEERDLARALEARLRAGLKQHFGLHSPHLREFGGRPRSLPRTPLPNLDPAARRADLEPETEPERPGAALGARDAGPTDDEDGGSPN
jgi:hypothetical protein